MGVEVGVRSLERSLQLHRSKAKELGDGAGANLLLFYAIECGLKAALLRRTSGRSTADLDPSLRTHDLRKLARELKIDGGLARRLTPCRSRETGQVHHHELHEAWRYGANLDREQEGLAVAALQALGAWCDQERG
ncbi:hypothetical protein OG943_29725 [Amycolatopsis sp. NBC_00345]|uniref:hypothetical protein n=1 Tax=Amycolatopsis sp. NBC_00345 TaxID=2975955 RepID=UPI002E26593C